jgi:hypothetical protein
MPLLPPSFLLRIAQPCLHVKDMPRRDDDRLLELPPECRIDQFTAMDSQQRFADVSLAWNELGLGLQVEVRGKEQAPQGDVARARGSDGVTLWLDTRGARGGHRASRYCHQFHFLAAGAGTDHDEPAFVQTKINRALEDAPHVAPSEVALLVQPIRGGYRLEAFLPTAALNGYDPEQYPRLGFFYAVRDQERGEQLLALTAEFPFWEDPSLWTVLELVRER